MHNVVFVPAQIVDGIRKNALRIAKHSLRQIKSIINEVKFGLKALKNEIRLLKIGLIFSRKVALVLALL